MWFTVGKYAQKQADEACFSVTIDRNVFLVYYSHSCFYVSSV